MTEIISGLIRSPEVVALVVHTLEADGVPTADIGLVTTAGESEEALAIEWETRCGTEEDISASDPSAIVSLVAGLTLISGVGSDGVALVAVGPLLGALAGAGAGWAFGGGVGAGTSIAIPRRKVVIRIDELQHGAVLVGVRCETEDRRRFVLHVLRDNGAERIAAA